MKRVDSRTEYEGKVIDVRIDSFEGSDGETREREIVAHPGAVAILDYDERSVFMVRQPREAVGVDDLLELPAGKLDEEGEDALATAKRELAEEIGKGARSWRHMKTFYSSAGFSDEEVHVYLATDLYDERAETDENERIEVQAVPLDRLDEAIAASRDAKTLIGLLWFRAYGDGGP